LFCKSNLSSILNKFFVLFSYRWVSPPTEIFWNTEPSAFVSKLCVKQTSFNFAFCAAKTFAPLPLNFAPLRETNQLQLCLLRSKNLCDFRVFGSEKNEKSSCSLCWLRVLCDPLYFSRFEQTFIPRENIMEYSLSISQKLYIYPR
jgi:hypothetical protein